MFKYFQHFVILFFYFSCFCNKTESQFTETPDQGLVQCSGSTINLRWNYMNASFISVQWFYKSTEMMSKVMTNSPTYSNNYNSSIVEFITDAEISLKDLITSSTGSYSCRITYFSGSVVNSTSLTVYDTFTIGLTCRYNGPRIECTKPDASISLNATTEQGMSIDMDNVETSGNYTICMYGDAILCKGGFPTCTTVEVNAQGKQTKEKSNVGGILGGSVVGGGGICTCILVVFILSNVPYTVYVLRKQTLILGRGLPKNCTARWWKNGEEKTDPESQLLVIENAKDSDEGKYVCEYSIEQKKYKLLINVFCIDGKHTAIQRQSMLLKDFLPMSFKGYTLKRLHRKSSSKNECENLNNLSHEDDGLYSCECVNPGDKDQQLNILLNIIDRKVIVTEGNHVDLKKKDFNFETQKELIRWTLDGQPWYREKFIATGEYQGVYMCEWFTRVRKKSKKKIKVELVVNNREITAVVGQKLMAKDIWQHVSVANIKGPSRVFSVIGKLLCLDKISHEDEGIYECNCSDDGGQQLQLKFRLNVVDREITAVVGQKLMAKDIWQHISVAYIKGPTREFSDTGKVLCLDKISHDDKGIYECNYSNDGGQQLQLKFRLNVVDCKFKAYVGHTFKPNDVWPQFQVKCIKGPNGRFSDNVGNLYFENLSQADDGIYQCECCDDDGKDIQLEFLLSVFEEEKVSSHAQGATSTTKPRDTIEIISEIQNKYESRSNQLDPLGLKEKSPLLNNTQELTVQPLPNIPESENGKKRNS